MIYGLLKLFDLKNSKHPQLMKHLQGFPWHGKTAWAVLEKVSFTGARVDSFPLHRKSISLWKQTFTHVHLPYGIFPRKFKIPQRRDCGLSLILHICVSGCWKQGARSSGIGVIGNCDLTWVPGSELVSSPLKEQYVLSAIEPSVQPLKACVCVYWFNKYIMRQYLGITSYEYFG